MQEAEGRHEAGANIGFLWAWQCSLLGFTATVSLIRRQSAPPAQQELNRNEWLLLRLKLLVCSPLWHWISSSFLAKTGGVFSGTPGKGKSKTNLKPVSFRASAVLAQQPGGAFSSSCRSVHSLTYELGTCGQKGRWPWKWSPWKRHVPLKDWLRFTRVLATNFQCWTWMTFFLGLPLIVFVGTQLHCVSA